MCGEGLSGGGGGGGGSAPLGGASGLSLVPTAEEAAENSLLDGAPVGERARDVLALGALPAAEKGSYQCWVRSFGGGAAVDELLLLLADHGADVEAFALGTDVVLGSRAAARRAGLDDGTDVTANLSGSATPLAVAAGQAVVADLGAESELLVLEARRSGGPGDPGSSGVLVQIPDGAGWRTVAHRHPRRRFEAMAVPLGGAGRVRLQFLSAAEVGFAGRLVRSAQSPVVRWAMLETAWSACLGDVSGAVTGSDSAAVSMAGRDTLRLAFTAPAPAEGQMREAFLVVGATLLEGRQSGSARHGPASDALPTRFALEQNRPNPFARSSGIHFALPAGAMVRLEVFDPQGRRLRTLANRHFPPGFHAIAWDQRDDEGGVVSPGVYFYRLQAGPFRDQKKMVVLGRLAR
jgi:hypothetical protein